MRISDIEKKINREVIIRQTQISTSKPGVLRGIHAEPQDKIITPMTGLMLAVFVDLRKNSDTLGHHIAMEFDMKEPEATPYTSVFIPERVGNSFCVHGKKVVVYQYAVSKEYDPKTAGKGVRWDDPELGIQWPIENPVISERDVELPSFSSYIKNNE